MNICFHYSFCVYVGLSSMQDRAEEIFKEIDLNDDKVIDFKEFCMLTTRVACDCYQTIEYLKAKKAEQERLSCQQNLEQ